MSHSTLQSAGKRQQLAQAHSHLLRIGPITYSSLQPPSSLLSHVRPLPVLELQGSVMPFLSFFPDQLLFILKNPAQMLHPLQLVWPDKTNSSFHELSILCPIHITLITLCLKCLFLCLPFLTPTSFALGSCVMSSSSCP